jgi:polyhydroxybutyrate depolymerase
MSDSLSRSIEVGGIRRGCVIVGDRAAGADGPGRDLVLVFHGSKQSGEKHRDFTGRAFDALADEGDAVVAYLDGYRGNWNDGRRESRFPARLEQIDDVGFVAAVIERMAEDFGIDRRRVFAVGYSNGGQMVFRLMHEPAVPLAGALVIAATMPDKDNFLLPDTITAPIPVVLVHGTKDPMVSYSGGEAKRWIQSLFKVGGRHLSAPETANYYAIRNGITASPFDTQVSGSRGTPKGTSVARTEYRQEGLPPVALYTVHGGGHTVPGRRKAPRLFGRTSRDISAADLARELLGAGRAG